MSETYVHGYDERANVRLKDQADALVDLLHADTSYPDGSEVLEAGCGVGAQTVTLAARSPGARFTSVDISADSLAEAKRRSDAAGLSNVRFARGDVFALPYEPESFDHLFVCFLLEHLSRPVEALIALQRLIKPGGTVTVIEGDHGSTYFHPDSVAAQRAVQCQVDLQRAAGGDANIGRRVYPLMVDAGVDGVRVSPRMVYVDSSRPRCVRRRHPGSSPHGRTRRRLLLHVFQGCRTKARRGFSTRTSVRNPLSLRHFRRAILAIRAS